jgi:trigger factor
VGLSKNICNEIRKTIVKIESQKLENHETKIIVEVSAEEFEPLKIQAARKIAGQAKIAGFRPGKAPYEIIRRNYGDQAIEQEALDILLEKQYEQILKEASIEPGGMGKLDKIEQIAPPKFSIIVPLAPSVNLNSYRDVREDFVEPELTETEVANAIEELKKPFAVAEPIDAPAAEGHTAYVLIKAEIEDPDAESGSRDLIKEMPYEFVIGQDTDEENSWSFAGFTKNLLGKEAGQIITTEYVYPEDTLIESLKGKKAVFTTTIQSIKKLVLPADDLEFTKNYGEFDSYEAFVEDVKKRLLIQKNHLYEDEFIDKVLSKIIDQSDIQFSLDTLEQEVNDMVEDLKHRLSHQNLDLDTYLKLKKTDMEKFLNEEIKPNAENQLKRRLVIEKFASEEKIQINFDKFKEAIASLEKSAAQELQLAKTKKDKAEITNRITTTAMNQTYSDAIFERLISIAKGENPAIESDHTDKNLDESALVKSEELITPEATDNSSSEE